MRHANEFDLPNLFRVSASKTQYTRRYGATAAPRREQASPEPRAARLGSDVGIWRFLNADSAWPSNYRLNESLKLTCLDGLGDRDDRREDVSEAVARAHPGGTGTRPQPCIARGYDPMRVDFAPGFSRQSTTSKYAGTAELRIWASITGRGSFDSLTSPTLQEHLHPAQLGR